MAMGRPKAVLVLSPQQREQLEGLANSRSLPAGLVSRARIILLSASGKTNQQIAGHTSKYATGPAYIPARVNVSSAEALDAPPVQRASIPPGARENLIAIPVTGQAGSIADRSGWMMRRGLARHHKAGTHSRWPRRTKLFSEFFNRYDTPRPENCCVF